MKSIRTISKLDAVVQAPPSKAHTLRALFIASLASGRSTLKNALNAEDQRLSAAALRRMGAKINFDGNDFHISGVGGMPRAPAGKLYLGNSGAGIRFIMSAAALAKGPTVIDGSARMRKRPANDLIDALRQLGIVIGKAGGKAAFPVVVRGNTFNGGVASLSGEKSSQYFSSILISAPYAQHDVTIRATKAIKSRPYIDITLQCMREFGARASNKGYRKFFVEAGKGYKGRQYAIEGDYSNASYFFAAAALTGGKVVVKNLKKNSKQGDMKFIGLLKKMGCTVRQGSNNVEVAGPTKLRAIKADMGDMPDIVPTLAVVAACASGTTKITNIEHLRIKESDRIGAVVRELRKLGVKATESKGGMSITGGIKKGGGTVETYNDHRIAMSFAVLGLRQEGIKIKNPGCVSKSFPDFFRKLGELY